MAKGARDWRMWIGPVAASVGLSMAIWGAGGAEYRFQVSDGVTDLGERWELREDRVFTWGVRGFGISPAEELVDAVLLIRSSRALSPAETHRGRTRFHLLDTAENPYNALRDEGMFPRGRLRSYPRSEWPGGGNGGLRFPWTAQVEVLVLTEADLYGEGSEGWGRYSLGERGLLEYFKVFLANGSNFGLAIETDGFLGSPEIWFVVITREPVPVSAATLGRPVPRIGPDPVRMPEGGATVAMLAIGLGLTALWWAWRRC